jgi:hypothetical protein
MPSFQKCSEPRRQCSLHSIRWALPPEERCRTPRRWWIRLLLFVLSLIPFAYDRSIGVDLLVIVSVFGAVPQTVAVILIDRPATIFVFVVVVGTLAATEATTEIVRVIVVRKTQWLH